MKKALKHTSLSSTSKFVRRVLSKTSNEKDDDNQEMVAETKNSNFDSEINALKEQIAILQLTVKSMQDETEKKEVALAGLAREKESLSSDLRKQRRSNSSLKQQLQDEREYYYKEKERYCQEMNDCKRIKKQIAVTDDKLECEKYKNEIGRLKAALSQTLEANYNLSVKFLRMKNTKSFLKERLKTLEEQHEKAISELKREVQDLKATIKDVVSKEFQLPISPSHKKFLKIIKENGNLVHENLCLQLEVDSKSIEIERLKRQISRSDTQTNLKYVNSKTRSSSSSERKEKKVVRIDSNTTIIQHSSGSEVETITKLYERRKTPDVPVITELPAIEHKPSRDSSANTLRSVRESMALMQVSSDASGMFGSENGSEPIRTQSAPEIVQSSVFSDSSKSCDFKLQL